MRLAVWFLLGAVLPALTCSARPAVAELDAETQAYIRHAVDQATAAAKDSPELSSNIVAILVDAEILQSKGGNSPTLDEDMHTLYLDLCLLDWEQNKRQPSEVM